MVGSLPQKSTLCPARSARGDAYAAPKCIDFGCYAGAAAGIESESPAADIRSATRTRSHIED